MQSKALLGWCDCNTRDTWIIMQKQNVTVIFKLKYKQPCKECMTCIFHTTYGVTRPCWWLLVWFCKFLVFWVAFFFFSNLNRFNILLSRESTTWETSFSQRRFQSQSTISESFFVIKNSKIIFNLFNFSLINQCNASEKKHFWNSFWKEQRDIKKKWKHLPASCSQKSDGIWSPVFTLSPVITL